MSFGQYSFSLVRGDSGKKSKKKKCTQPEGKQEPVYITSAFYSTYRSSRYTAKCVSEKWTKEFLYPFLQSYVYVPPPPILSVYVPPP